MHVSSVAMALFLVAAASSAQGRGGASTLALEPDSAGRIEHRLEVSPHGEVELDSADGFLRVIGAPVRHVEVRGRLGRGVESLDLTHAGRYVRLWARPVDGAPSRPLDLDSELEVTVPVGHDLVIRTHGAEVRVQGSAGRLGLQSVRGEIHVEGQPRRVEAVSVSGNIHLQVVTPEALARSVSGEVRISGRIESLEAETVDVLLAVDAALGVEGLLRTVTGRLHYGGDLARTARLRAESSSGQVELTLPPGIEAAFVLETVAGTLETAAFFPDLPVPAVNEDRTAPAGAGRQRQAFRTGEAPRRVEVSTISGSVHLLPRVGREPGSSGAEP